MTRFPSRLPSGYSLWHDGADVILKFGSEDVVYTWFEILPVVSADERLALAFDLDERIQQDRERRRRWATMMLAGLTGANPALREDVGYPLHPWGYGGRMA